MHCHIVSTRRAFVALVLFTSPTLAQAPARPFDARIDSIFAAYDKPDSPGCALGVYRDGQIVYARGYGMADLERNVPITPRTVFDIGSTSKQFAAATIVMLAADGKLSLDDDVRRHIPELPVYERPITIRQMLHHTSGLRDYIGLLTLAGERIDGVTTAAEALAMLVRQRELNFMPGSAHLYSNSGYFLLSIIIERVTGRSLREVAQERIFAPLGMAHTEYLGSYDDLIPHRAIAYAPRQDGRLRVDVSRWLQLGDGAIFTTVEDLLRWDENFYTARVGGAGMLAALHTRGVLTNGDTLEYALGLIHGTHRGLRTVSHGGSWGGYRAELLRFPDQHFSVATLCNLATSDPSTLAMRVAEIHLGTQMEPVVASNAGSAAGTPLPATAQAPAEQVPVAELRELAGMYRDPATRALRTILLDGDQLYLSAGRRYEMQPSSDTAFTLVGTPAVVLLVFERPAGDRPRRLRFTVNADRPVFFDRIETVTPTVEQLKEYTGSFSSAELEARYTLAVADGALRLSRKGHEPATLRPMTCDEFDAGGTTLYFTRSDAGTITGFTLGQGRVRNIRFDRAQP